MAEFIRVAEFEADQAALDALLAELNSTGGPPEDVPATRITVLANRSGGKVLIGTRFASEEDLRKGSEALEGMTPPSGGNIRRISVDSYEVVLERQV
jgi:hypothetical protein